MPLVSCIFLESAPSLFFTAVLSGLMALGLVIHWTILFFPSMWDGCHKENRRYGNDRMESPSASVNSEHGQLPNGLPCP